MTAARIFRGVALVVLTLGILVPIALADSGAAPANTVRPALSGTAKDGQTLTTTNGTWTGTDPITYTYQWLRCDPVSWLCTTISGATSATYVLTSAEVGFKMVSAVTATNSSGQATANSYGSAIVAPTPPVNTAKPTLSGVAKDGQALTSSTGTWSGTTPLTVGYQWSRCNPVSWACSNISGATSSTYTVGAADVGFRIVDAVSASNAAGQASANSYASSVVAAQVPANVARPALSGNATQGQALSSTTGVWTGTQPITYTYQWQRCNPISWACSNVSGATSSSYILTAADVGYKMISAVTAANVGGPMIATSYGSAVVAGSGGSALYVSPSGSDSGSCSQSAPCLSFDRAYQVASLGSTVLVTCGGNASCSYPTQRLSYKDAKTKTGTCRWSESFQDGQTSQDLSGCITFKPASDASPTLSGLSIGVPDVMVDSVPTDTSNGSGVNIGWDTQIGGSCASYSVHDVILKNTSGTMLNVSGAHYLYVVNSSFGPFNDNSSNVEPCYMSSSDHSNTDHVAIDGTTFHDFIQVSAGAHDECIHWQDTDQGIVRNSRFLNCAQQDISFHPRNFGFDRLTHITVENNVFDMACSNQGSPCGIVSGGQIVMGCNPNEPLSGFLIRYNSFDAGGGAGEGIEFDTDLRTCASGSGNITVTGNLMGGPATNFDCTNWTNDGVSLDHNIFFRTIPCGTANTTGISASTIYTNPSPGTWNYTEKTGAPSIDYIANGVPYPPTDIVGEPRPQHNAPDAGAYEHP